MERSLARIFYWTLIVTLCAWLVLAIAGLGLRESEAVSGARIVFVALLYAYATAATMARLLPADCKPFVPLLEFNGSLICNVIFVFGATMWYIEAVQPGRFPQADSFFLFASMCHLATWTYQLPAGCEETLVVLNRRLIDGGQIVLIPPWWLHEVEYFSSPSIIGKTDVTIHEGDKRRVHCYEYEAFFGQSPLAGQKVPRGFVKRFVKDTMSVMEVIANLNSVRLAARKFEKGHLTEEDLTKVLEFPVNTTLFRYDLNLVKLVS